MKADEIKEVRLVNAQIHGLKKLLHVEITLPESGVFAIRGKERAGKSTTVDSFAYHLAGGNISREVIQRGEEKAVMLCEHETNLGPVISRMVITEKSGRHITVYPKDKGTAAKFSSPGQLLESWYGAAFLDIVQWVQLSETPDGRRRQMQMAGQLFDRETQEELCRLKAEYDRAYGQRTIANAKADEANRQLREQEADYNRRYQRRPPAKPVDTSQAILALGGAQRIEADLAEGRKRKITLEETVVRLRMQLETAEKNLKQTTAAVERMERPLEPKGIAKRAGLETLPDVKAQFEALADRLRERGPLTLDLILGELRAQISGASDVNEQYHAAVRLRGARDHAESCMKEQAQIKADLEKARKGQAEIQKSARWPIPGLAFAKDGLLWQGLPFTREHISESEMYAVATDVLLEFHERRRKKGEVLSHPLLLCREGSPIGEETLRMMDAKARKYQALIIMAKSGTQEGPVGIVLEEGRIKEQESEDGTGNKGN